METWNLPKGKDAKNEDAEGDGPKTPASGRGKRAAATPSTAGTGAGVKKRGSASKNSAAAASGGSRARKAKSEAIVKMEDLNQDEDDDEEEENEDEDMLPETPTKKGGRANRVKSEFGSKSANNRPMATGIDYTNFPAVLPNMVLERKAIYVNLNGTWTLSPVSVQAHAQWLAGLPANIQTQFYAQVTAAGGKNGHSKFIDEDDKEATAGTQLLGEQFNGAVPVEGALPGAGINMPMGMGMGMGYDGAAAPNAGGYHGAQTGKIDLHSIPMHPSYMAQMEKDLREQEERDHATLFGGQNGF